MTVSEFALSIVTNREYRASIERRAEAGTLPEEVELLLLELEQSNAHNPLDARLIALLTAPLKKP